MPAIAPMGRSYREQVPTPGSERIGAGCRADNASGVIRQCGG